jgi:GNAT superfamily N-acetyltransferase
LYFHPLTPDRWNDLELLFGEKGACGGCWCMWWRLSHSEFTNQKGEKNKKALKNIVDSGQIPGIIAYVDGNPIGWCSISPRETYPRLERSRLLKRIDDEHVWSIVCFYIKKEFRRKGISFILLKAVLDYVKQWGGTIVEGYPIEPKKSSSPDLFVYTGLASTFRKAGFKEVVRRSETRPIMRFRISN